jgi:protein-S-isoprenylcysteine O-methyltransferase Ste14
MLKLPPPVWGLLYLVAAGVLSALFPWREALDLRQIPLGIVLATLGVAIAASAVFLFRSEGTEIDPTSKTNKMLVIRGPYRYSRNPMYLGVVFLTFGIAFVVGSLPMFAVPLLLFATANWVHIPFEEAKMRRQFGSAYDDFTLRVRRWI